MARALAVFVVLFCLLSVCYGSKQQIHSLPGLDNMPSFKNWAGYINVNETLGKEYYYWFVESQNDPATDPVLLWMQGGPGCSGLLGFWQENGPFQLRAGGKVVENPLSWNKKANIIYLEQPAGVGFSYSTNPNGYQTDDNQTAVDNYQFLQGWFEEFPEYRANEFWLTGESYAGVYIPTLANEILDGSDTQLLNQFQGYMLGNPVIHCPAWIEESRTVIVNNWYWHALISYSSRVAWYQADCHINSTTSTCNNLYYNLYNGLKPYDADNLFMNFCTGNATLTFNEEVPECLSLDILLDVYLNRPAVRQAIHAKPPSGTIWSACSDTVAEEYTQLGLDMLNYYNKFFAQADWNILVYNGDIDISTVPHAYTQLCLSALNRPVVKPWTRWTIPGPTIPSTSGPSPKSNITAGYQEIYDSYSFATVRGAGHEVPTFQPLFAYNMFERFIVNKQNL